MIRTVCHGSNPWISAYWSFLVLEKAPTARIKAVRSLQVYNQPVSGFLSCVKGQKIGNNYIVLGKVRHSQNKRSVCYIVDYNRGKWYSALFAHCVQCVGCMGGQGECYTHFASVLFYIEAWNHVNEVHRWNVVGWCQRPSKTRPFQILILDRQRN